MIVGAGAAGLAAGIFCARLRPDLRITILDGAQKIGAKILVSGGGRCNVTNVRVIAEDFWGGSRNTIRRVLRAFTEKQTVEFFHEIGVSLHEEQWGKLFPDSNSAKTVLNALLSEAGRLGVTIMP
ncbi:MAG: NAD(P)/FAD-dependent oxidoreductase, partial [Planctomycetes bacterium]|nr:NAD(P)/FAD-dependent oxidoreductase [Planctomycetota bacterium]